MLLIICPHCGPRTSAEFTYQGEVTARPSVKEASPREWRAYLYEKDNTAGDVTEQWLHASGCRRFLLVERNTITNVIRAVRDRADR